MSRPPIVMGRGCSLSLTERHAVISRGRCGQQNQKCDLLLALGQLTPPRSKASSPDFWTDALYLSESDRVDTGSTLYVVLQYQARWSRIACFRPWRGMQRLPVLGCKTMWGVRARGVRPVRLGGMWKCRDDVYARDTWPMTLSAARPLPAPNFWCREVSDQVRTAVRYTRSAYVMQGLAGQYRRNSQG
jgi:hypothetical protein